MSKELTKTSKMLMWMCAGVEALSIFLVTPHELRKRALKGNIFKTRNDFYSLYSYLLRKGYIQLVDKNAEQFVKITKKGELAILLARAKLSSAEPWDGKWRVIIFDIPEASRLERNRFRRLLKEFGFLKLQASVFVSPKALNRRALDYLKQSGLMKYIRILKVEEMDDDSDLRKLFGIKSKAK